MIFLNKTKNYIMNGALDFWQRGFATMNPINSSLVGADRFKYRYVLIGSQNLTKDSDVPSEANSLFNFSSSMLFNTTAVKSPLDSLSLCCIEQIIEGLVFSPLMGRKITLSFWVKSDISGNYSVSFANSTGSRSYVSVYTINTANTWEKKSITISHDTTGSWKLDIDAGLRVRFCFAAGSSYTTNTTDSWLSSNAYATPSCVNLFGVNNTNFRITGIQLEEGVEASNFERFGGDYLSDLNACLRYYEQSYDLGTPAFSATSTGRYLLIGRCSSTSVMSLDYLSFKSPKRAMNSYSFANSSGGLAWDTHIGSCSIQVNQSSTSGFRISALTTGLTSGSVGWATGHWMVDGDF